MKTNQLRILLIVLIVTIVATFILYHTFEDRKGADEREAKRNLFYYCALSLSDDTDCTEFSDWYWETFPENAIECAQMFDMRDDSATQAYCFGEVTEE